MNEWREKAMELADEVERLKVENEALTRSMLDFATDFAATRLLDAVAQATSIDHKHRLLIIEHEKLRDTRDERTAWERLSAGAPEAEWTPMSRVWRRLLSKIAAMDPIQDDHNEQVVRWCAFCAAESATKFGQDVEHKTDCLWVRVRASLGLDKGAAGTP